MMLLRAKETKEQWRRVRAAVPQDPVRFASSTSGPIVLAMFTELGIHRSDTFRGSVSSDWRQARAQGPSTKQQVYWKLSSVLHPPHPEKGRHSEVHQGGVPIVFFSITVGHPLDHRVPRSRIVLGNAHGFQAPVGRHHLTISDRRARGPFLYTICIRYLREQEA